MSVKGDASVSKMLGKGSDQKPKALDLATIQEVNVTMLLTEIRFMT